LKGKQQNGGGKLTEFTELEKKIALALLGGEKTLNEIEELFPQEKDSIKKTLARMLKLGLVEKKDTKYSLKESIAKEIEKRRDIIESDFFKLRLKSFIEMQAVNKELLERELSTVETALKKQKDFTIYSVKKAEIIEQEGYYSSFLEVDFTVRNFPAIIKFIFFFSPTTLEIIRPPKIEITAFDLQEGLMDLIQMIEKYNSFIRKEMSKKELESFHKKLSQGRLN